jgi:ATP-binding cassette subfamily B protein
MIAAYRPLLRLLRGHRRRLALTILCAAGATAAAVLVPLLVGSAVNKIQQENKQGLVVVTALIVLAGVLSAALYSARGMLAGYLSLDVERELRDQLYAKWQELDLRFLDNRPSAHYVTMTIADVMPLTNFLGVGLAALIQAVLIVLVSAAVMIALQPLLALIVLTPLPLAVWLLHRFGVKGRPEQVSVRERTAEVAGELEETLAGIVLVKVYGLEDQRLSRYRAVTARLLQGKLRFARLTAGYVVAAVNLPVVSTAAVVIVGARLAIHGQLSVVQFSVFYTYLVMLAPSIATIGVWVRVSETAVAIAGRLEELLARESSIRSQPDADQLPPGPGALELRDIRVQSGAEKPLLDHVDAAMPGGGRIAIVGANGSGKTTLLSLINRLYDADDGDVRIDGVAVREVDLGSLRRQIASAGDDSFLFSGSVRDNVAYARPRASDDDVERAARVAQAHDFILKLPEGYETVLGNRGITLSGGQRQRIAVARAVLAAPRILVLDNATGALDTATEAELLDALRDHLKGRTTVLVAYRESSTRLADEVIVLAEGGIVDRGTHAELVARSASYRELIGVDPPADGSG